MLARSSKSFVVSRHCLYLFASAQPLSFSSILLKEDDDSHTIEIKRTAIVRDFAFFAMAATFSQQRRIIGSKHVKSIDGGRAALSQHNLSSDSYGSGG